MVLCGSVQQLHLHFPLASRGVSSSSELTSTANTAHCLAIVSLVLLYLNGWVIQLFGSGPYVTKAHH